ncbi:MAG: polyprenyl synthetase family protein [Bdellovibrionales bacterium]|nr:polyprenyl synthetase family protein [Bdellovibrionales bacterium]
MDALAKEFLPRLDRLFHEVIQTELQGSPLREMLEYQWKSGGKRLRPLCVAVAAGDARHTEEALRFALAVELIHNATLIHDDIQDGDIYRRGQPTLWKKYGLAHGINAGDALFFLPQVLLENPALLGLLHRCTLAVIEGQCREVDLRERFARGEEFSMADYERMVAGKTSALFRMPVEGGRIIAGEVLSREERHALEALGLAFQIQDDMLDLWGEKGRDRRGSDIAEGKLSYPVVEGLRLLEGPARREFVRIVTAPREETTPAEVEWAIDALERCGAREAAMDRISFFRSKAALGGGLLDRVRAIIFGRTE